MTISTLFLIISISSVSATTSVPDVTKQQHSLLSIVSVRNNTSFDLNELTILVDNTITKFNVTQTCSNETAIYIHGFNKDKNDAGEEFNRIQTSLNDNSYKIPLIGFSWKSNVLWPQAKANAINSGEELAKFIYKFKETCPNTNIHIIAHSLGAAVVENTLNNLVKYLDLKNINNTSKIIKSVHLLGAAINNELIMNNTPFGNAINDKVEKFYNLYNPEDDGLEANRLIEKHNPLGSVGAPNQNVPTNYKDINVLNEIPALSDADGDGNLEECFEDYGLALKKGDNHCGYIGFREPFSNSLIDDGAIDVVVRDWRNP
ncbi:MAG: alpha/beta hydrolase [Nitrososphaeraceae archaeon]|nr:alpha/beta hydrolase [Nitrososphaeraceae archaeon]